MQKVAIDSERVSEVKVGGDWYSIKHESLIIGPLVWTQGLGDHEREAGELGFRFEIYGSQGMVVSGPMSAISAVRFTE
ncbi:MAG: hypothetical protein ACXIVQ_00195 [Acidimicrobiales bacterium]